MKLNGTYQFEAAPERVFDVMTDPAVVAACLPGCERLEPVGEHRYAAVLTIGIAAMTGRYEGTVELFDLDRPRSYGIRVSGKGAPGSVTGEGSVTLSPDGAATTVSVAGEGKVVGTIARVGQRLLGSVSKMMTDRFFACLQQRVSTEP